MRCNNPISPDTFKMSNEFFRLHQMNIYRSQYISDPFAQENNFKIDIDTLQKHGYFSNQASGGLPPAPAKQ